MLIGVQWLGTPLRGIGGVTTLAGAIWLRTGCGEPSHAHAGTACREGGGGTNIKGAVNPPPLGFPGPSPPLRARVGLCLSTAPETHEVSRSC